MLDNKSKIKLDLSLNKELIRIAKNKRRALANCNYIKSNAKKFNAEILELLPKAELIENCVNDLLIVSEGGDYYLLKSQSCKQSFLCPNCASSRAIKYANLYYKKYFALKEENPNLRIYYTVFTVKNGIDLQKTFNYLNNSFKTLMKHMREGKIYLEKGYKKFAYAKNTALINVKAGAYSFEIKRGKNSGLWHPHLNMVTLSEKPLNYGILKKEWNSISKQKSNLHCNFVQPNNEKKSFLEIFKYSLKFSDMVVSDNITAYFSLRGKRLFGSFGSFRGLHIAKDEKLDYAFLDEFYRFNGNIYQFTNY